MHDRRIDGEPHVFGNHGALVMNAMTWWDHKTGSVWSQPWGRAIAGDYKGVELFLIPSQLTTWESWVSAHPDTLLMINNLDQVGLSREVGFNSDFVLGLLLQGQARAYYYRDVEALTVLNDRIGDQPIVVYAQDTVFAAYLRQFEGQVLTFTTSSGTGVMDRETGSTWDFAKGVAIEGELQGTALQQIPGLSSYDWAWEDFYPDSTFYTP